MYLLKVTNQYATEQLINMDNVTYIMRDSGKYNLPLYRVGFISGGHAYIDEDSYSEIIEREGLKEVSNAC